MKIVQVTPRYPPHTGGVETHVKEISERLVERGHEVVVLTAGAGADVAARERRNGVAVKRHRSFAPGGAFHVTPGIARSVRRERADLIHAHNYHSLPAVFAAVAAGRTPFVITPHYHGRSADAVRDVLLSAYRPLGRWAFRRADTVVAVSDWERKRLRADFGVEATVIPNGLDIERFATAKPEQRDGPYLLCVGRMEEYKGVQHVIRALPELDGYDLVVTGTGPYRTELERIARREGVDDRVEFLGFVPDARLPGLYAGASAFLALSEFEAYGLTVAEALASGTPCVVRTVGALADWTDDPGVVGIESPTPERVSNAVAVATELESETNSILDWEEIVNRLDTIYRCP